MIFSGCATPRVDGGRLEADPRPEGEEQADRHRACRRRRAEGAPSGKLSNALFSSTVWFSIKPSGPPPLKMTEKASAPQDQHLGHERHAEDGAVSVMWKWHSAAMTTIAPIANTSQGCLRPGSCSPRRW